MCVSKALIGLVDLRTSAERDKTSLLPLSLTLQATHGQCTNMQSCITLGMLHATYAAHWHGKSPVIHATAA